MSGKIAQPQAQESAKATAGFLVVASGLYNLKGSLGSIAILIGVLIMSHAVFRIFENYSKGIK